MEARSQIIADLEEFEQVRAVSADRRIAELDEEGDQLFALLIRARDAGLKNGEIATALNGGPSSAWWTTQSITREMRIAEYIATQAVERLIRGEGDPPDEA